LRLSVFINKENTYLLTYLLTDYRWTTLGKDDRHPDGMIYVLLAELLNAAKTDLKNPW